VPDEATARTALVPLPAAASYAPAVLGWGRVTPFFCHPALTALTISGFVLGGVAYCAEGT
jgi:hypothetical protein